MHKARCAPLLQPAIEKTLRIGLVSTSFPVSDNPASGAFVYKLAEHLSRHVQLSVVTPCATSSVLPAGRSGFSIRCFRYAPCRWQRLAHQPGGIPAALRHARWLYALLPIYLAAMLFACMRVSRRCDLVHANWSVNGAVAGLAARLFGTPVITTLRGSDIKRLETSRLEQAVLKLCFRTNVRLICVSEVVRKRVLETLPQCSAAVTVIANGVDDVFLRLAAEKRASHVGGMRILSVGSLVQGKGMHSLVEALQLMGEASDATVTIIGDGPERKRLETRIAKAGLQDRVKLVGTVPPSALPRHFAETDVFVLASSYEGRPNAVLEAMAAALPVVATRIEAIAELVTDERTGLLFSPHDAAALAAHLLRLQEDPELRAELGGRARNAIQERGLVWDKTAEAYASLYRTILSAD